jgi:DNA topoisomerase-1
MERYTLVITEKPDAALRIASALDVNEKPRRMEDRRVPYYVAKRDRGIVVVPALGHLYTVVAEKKGRNYYPVFDFKWVPRYAAEKQASHIRTWLEVISKLAKNADDFIDACDYDIEGSIIGYSILKYACEGKEQISKRMKYSTLTKEELEKAYTKLLPHLDFALVEAGLARHEVDWLYGINLTRALTTTAKRSSGQYATLSTGRVQGPTLTFLATREKAIKTFVPTPYWTIRAQAEIDEQTLEAECEKEKIDTKKEAEAIVNACQWKDGRVEKIDARQFQQLPPFPFDLGALQVEAYRLFRYTPSRTLKIAQHLYVDALISYPRTSSQKLPSAIDHEAILKNLNKSAKYRQLTTELLSRPQPKPTQGKKEDPAHPAIHPTGNLPQRTLDNSERNILDLVIRRFMAVFAEPALRQTYEADITINGYHFFLRGQQTLKKGWLRFYYPYAKPEEAKLPPIKEGEQICIRKIVLEDKFTKPPPRYNPSSALKKMEQQEIGTKATRADVIQTLYDRKYIRDERITVTDLGFTILEVLEEYCPTIVSIRLTRELEGKMNGIQMNSEKREKVLKDTVQILEPVIETFKKNEKAIGQQLSDAVRASKLEERTIGTCPICKTGKLLILYSKKTGKRFAGCSNYFKELCKASFPLPQKGTIKPLGKGCRACSWPTVQARTKGRGSWTLCLNPKCPQKQEWRKKVEVQNMHQRSPQRWLLRTTHESL